MDTKNYSQTNEAIYLRKYYEDQFNNKIHKMRNVAWSNAKYNHEDEETRNAYRAYRKQKNKEYYERKKNKNAAKITGG